jgi:hypothetical protein
MSYLNNTQVVDELVGEYNIPSTGEYWLEIIGILCNDLIWDENYRNVCLEDPAYMQITDDFAPVDATKADSTKAIGLDTGNGLVTNQAYHYTQDISPGMQTRDVGRMPSANVTGSVQSLSISISISQRNFSSEIKGSECQCNNRQPDQPLLRWIVSCERDGNCSQYMVETVEHFQHFGN